MKAIKLREVVDELINEAGDGFEAVCVVAVKGGRTGVALTAEPFSMGAVLLASSMGDVLDSALENECMIAEVLEKLGVLGGSVEKASMVVKSDSGDLGRVEVKPGEAGDSVAEVLKAALGPGYEAYMRGMRERAGR